MMKRRMAVIAPRVAAAFVLLWAISFSGQNSLSPVTRYFGATDGSAGVAVGDSYFVGATDENNVLRLYSATDGFESFTLLDLDFEFPPNKKGKLREYDLEGATRIGSLIYFIGSHGRNGDGEMREQRQVLFAAKVTGCGENTKLVELVNNMPYKRLLTDLQGDEALSNLKLSDAIGEKKSDPTKAPETARSAKHRINLCRSRETPDRFSKPIWALTSSDTIPLSCARRRQGSVTISKRSTSRSVRRHGEPIFSPFARILFPGTPQIEG
jgi:hypothetical protein